MLDLFRSPRRAIVWLVEASLLSLLCVAVAGLSAGWSRALRHDQLLRALLISVVVQGAMYYHGLYSARRLRLRELLLGVTRALLMAALVLWIVFRPTPYLVVLGAAAILLPAWRTAWDRLSESQRFRRAAIILGGGTLARECASLIESQPMTGLRLVGMLVPEGRGGPSGVEVLGGYADVTRIVTERGVEHILVACDERRGVLPVIDLLDLKLRGIFVEEGLDFYERVTGRMFVAALKPSDLLFAHGFHLRRSAFWVKRAVDLVAASVGLILCLPILAIAAVAIRLDSPGPILYTQIRTGVQGRPFRMHKLRSMRTNAEERGAVWALADDPRVTRVGRILRRTRVDEIPQLWNVLTGDMSLVGPRPERPVFVEQLEREIPFFRQRLCIKPGVTGHAQVRCRYGASIEDAREKLQYDLFYIKSFSFWFDLSILIDTVKVVLLRIGSR